MFGRPEADGETGEIFRVLRYVSIDGEFVNVDADEYEFMVSSCGGPYLTRVDFDRLRAQFLRGEREREEAGLYRRRDKPAVRPSNVSPEATPQTNPGAAKDSSNGPRRRAVLAIGALVILIAVLTWVFLRARRA